MMGRVIVKFIDRLGAIDGVGMELDVYAVVFIILACLLGDDRLLEGCW